jgi:hypothetical protein
MNNNINNITRRCLCALALAAGVVVSGIGHAQTTTSYAVGATCSGGGQLCNSIPTVTVTTASLLQVQFISSSSFACPNVRIHLIVDGTELAVTGFVAPAGASGFFNLGPVTAGSHVLGFQAEGQIHGCYLGTLGSWAGTVQVVTNGVTGAIPTLSEWGLILLLTLTGVVGVLHLRGRRRA